MTWVDPARVQPYDVITSALWNQQVVDNTLALQTEANLGFSWSGTVQTGNTLTFSGYQFNGAVGDAWLITCSWYTGSPIGVPNGNTSAKMRLRDSQGRIFTNAQSGWTFFPGARTQEWGTFAWRATTTSSHLLLDCIESIYGAENSGFTLHSALNLGPATGNLTRTATNHLETDPEEDQ